MLIYKATNKINNKIYVGQTTHSLSYRKRQHENNHLYRSTHKTAFSMAIFKYGKENFDWEVLCTANTIEELNKLEEFYIDKLDCLCSTGKGYNIRFGGLNMKHSETTKLKIGAAQTGDRNHMFGRRGIDSPSSKRLIDIHTGEIFESATICANKLGMSQSKICSVCRGDRGSTGGRVFRYIDKDNNCIEPTVAAAPFRKRVIRVYTGEIYNNCADTVKSINSTRRSSLSSALKDTGYGYLYGVLYKYEGVTIPDDYVPGRRKTGSYKVLNLTDNVTFDSITSASESVDGCKSGLARALKNNSDSCKYKCKEWKRIL